MRMDAAHRAVRRIRSLTPKDELRAWGLRMQARHGGLAVQRLYRMRGIVNPCAKATAVHIANCAKRRKLKSLAINEIEKSRSKNTLIYA
jgi:hypothetical protein